jgi:hypothetical protein
MQINHEDAFGFQALQIRKTIIGMQSTMVIYNTTQLRLLCSFPSRGTPALGGNNWVSDPPAAAGDFTPSNLNTDIIEQVYRSTSSALVSLTCDTGLPQGVPIDTIAILGHNLTRSATVQVQGSNDNFATPPAITFNMVTELQNMYWIAPELPRSAGQNRYWRFIIQDSTNPAGYVEIGAIIFGAANIFSAKESFLNPLVFGYKHFRDEMETEGFTSVTNDRALKKFLQLKFENLDYYSGNYGILTELITEARTSLKCLVIPTPEYASRYAVFAKLTELPEITFNDNGARENYVALDLSWDESR